MKRLRRLLVASVPICGSTLILAVVASRHDVKAALALATHARTGVFVLAVVALVVVTLFIESVYFALCIGWARSECVPLAEALRLRAAVHFLTVVNVLAGLGGLVALTARRFRLPHRVVAALVVSEMLHDLCALAALGLLAAMPYRRWAALVLAVGCVGFCAVQILARRTVCRPFFQRLTWDRQSKLFALRMSLHLCHGVFVAGTLSWFSVHAPLLQATGLAQAAELARSLPISVLGIGVDQVTFPFLFREWQIAAGGLLAYSLTYTAALLLVRATMGAFFMGGFVRSAVRT